jgi:glyoxylase-like metal-dependent hydrolase (beta-lactamase superfamily II)
MTVTGAAVRQLTDQAAVLLAPNPGPMTLDGTNTYLLGNPSGAAGFVVVDPGPDDAGHLDRLAAHGRVLLVLITHRHPDHTDGAAGLARRTGAPVRAADPDFCLDGPVLADGEELDVAGVRIRVVATPGHTTDSVSFVLPDDGVSGSVLTGDTVLGRGTTVIAHPDGRLGPYLDSLAILGDLGPATVLPAHGPVLPDLAAVAAAYRAHREERLVQVRAAIDALRSAGTQVSVAAVTDAVYTDIVPSVRLAAERSVAAQLAYLLG